LAPPLHMDSKIFLGKYRVAAEEIEAVGEPGDSPLAYEGEEIDSGKRVVVEAVPAASLKTVVREQLEAKAIAAMKLNHVNIRTLYDFGVEDDHLIYIAEDFDGTLVGEWVQTHGPMPVGPVMRIAAQVVSALGAAAFHGIVHRAINPSNLMLVPGQTAEGEWPLVKVLHFVGGAPKFLGADGVAAAYDKSLPYTSPEQLEHGVVDFRSEMYSLGSTMWFLLTGAPPALAPKVQMAVQSTKAGPAADKMSAVPKRIQQLLAQMLSVNPDARPRDSLAFHRQLQECLTDVDPPETSRTVGVSTSSQTRTAGEPAGPRIPMKMVALVAVFLAVTALAALVLPEYLRHRRVVVYAKKPSKVSIKTPAVLPSPTPVTPSAADTMVSIVTQPFRVNADTNRTPSVPAENVELSAPAKLRDGTRAALPQATPKRIIMREVRRAEPVEPEARRAELAHPKGSPANVAPTPAASPSQPTPSAAQTEQSRDAKRATTEIRPRKAKPTDSEPTPLPKVPR
jgi:serine/threonine protein kinase